MPGKLLNHPSNLSSASMSDLQVAAFSPPQLHMPMDTDQDVSNEQGPSTPPDQDTRLSSTEYNQTPVDPRLESLESSGHLNQDQLVEESVMRVNGEEDEIIQDNDAQLQSNQAVNDSISVPQHTGQVCRYDYLCL